jgi:hypothetical protein
MRKQEALKKLYTSFHDAQNRLQAAEANNAELIRQNQGLHDKNLGLSVSTQALLSFFNVAL